MELLREIDMLEPISDIDNICCGNGMPIKWHNFFYCFPIGVELEKVALGVDIGISRERWNSSALKKLIDAS
jgi:hypothetical protein